MRRLLKPLGAAALTLLGLLLATFVIGRVVPIDPVLAVVGDRASAETYARVRAEMALDEPLLTQFWRYALMVAQGDLGRSALTRSPVLEDILRCFPATLELATAATVLGVLLGIPAGVAAAVRQDRWPDHLLRFAALATYSVPVFWLGLMALLLFYAKLGWVAGPGRLDLFLVDAVAPRTGLMLVDAALAGEWAAWRSALAHLVLPTGVLGAFSAAYLSRMTRGFMLEQLRQDYVVTARAKGLSEVRVVWRHAFVNVLAPLATVVALGYAHLLEGSVLTETVFAWPGIGSYITLSLLSLDMNAVLGGTLLVGAALVAINLVVDALSRRFDPRAR
jgi:peptide/nickel transport system permease protein